MTRPLRLKPWLFHALGDEVHLLISDVAVESLARGKIDDLLLLLDGSRAEDDIVGALADVQPAGAGTGGDVPLAGQALATAGVFASGHPPCLVARRRCRIVFRAGPG